MNRFPSLERLGNKSAENIINSINKSKNTTMARFIQWSWYKKCWKSWYQKY